MVRANDYLHTRYLRKEDVRQSTVVTVERCYTEEFDAEEGPRLLVKFREFAKSLILNKTNIRSMIAIWGSDETDAWEGQMCVLYNDTTVQFKGRPEGGLRIRGLSNVERQAGDPPIPQPTGQDIAQPGGDSIPF